MVARRAHNPKVVGSNPAPATNSINNNSVAGWSSMVARRAHNPKVVGSNPAPATNFFSKFLLILLFLLIYKSNLLTHKFTTLNFFYLNNPLC